MVRRLPDQSDASLFDFEDETHELKYPLVEQDIFIDDDRFFSRHSATVVDDQAWFAAHPQRTYRMRTPTSEEQPELGRPPRVPSSFQQVVIVRQVAPGRRLRFGKALHALLTQTQDEKEMRQYFEESHPNFHPNFDLLAAKFAGGPGEIN